MDAILFDLDGTLIPSIDLYGEAVVHAMNEHDIDFTHENFKDFYQRTYSMSAWLEELGVDQSRLKPIKALRDEVYQDILRNRIGWIDGAEDVLKKLKTIAPIGVYTGSNWGYIDAIRERIDLDNVIDMIVTHSDTGDRPKPDPTGLYMLADKLGANPESCVYIGDQRFDIAAAKNAGMKSILIHTNYTPLDAHEDADHVINDLDEIEHILKGR